MGFPSLERSTSTLFRNVPRISHSIRTTFKGQDQYDSAIYEPVIQYCFATVADHFHMEGNGKLNMNSDCTVAGLPPIMPNIKSGSKMMA